MGGLLLGGFCRRGDLAQGGSATKALPCIVLDSPSIYGKLSHNISPRSVSFSLSILVVSATEENVNKSLRIVLSQGFCLTSSIKHNVLCLIVFNYKPLPPGECYSKEKKKNFTSN